MLGYRLEDFVEVLCKPKRREEANLKHKLRLVCCKTKVLIVASVLITIPKTFVYCKQGGGVFYIFF